MEIITHLNFNNGRYSFNFNGTGYQLIAANQYVFESNFYRYRNPLAGTENERFILQGDGNFILENSTLYQEIGVVIIERVGDNVNFTLSSLEFNRDFTIVV